MSQSTPSRRAMGRRRVAIVALELLIAFQGALATALPHPVPVEAAAIPLGVTAQSGPTAGTSCTLTAGSDGGVLSSCPDVNSYADFASGLELALSAAQGASSTSKLGVTSSPAGATVLINGLQAGLTPIDTTLPAGSYLVRISKDGFVPVSRTVTITADQPGTVNATLESAGGGTGSFEWLRAQTLITAAGGFTNGSLEVSDFLRDKAGVYYVSFVNLSTIEFVVDAPADAPGYVTYNTKPRIQLKTIGIAKSADGGRTWSIVKSWKETFSIRTWTSGKFTDAAWDPAAEKLSGPKEHWLRAFYKEQSSESYGLSGMVPLKDGGVSVQATHTTTHVAQQLEATWDNVGTAQAPTKYMGDGLIENAPAGGQYRTQASAKAMGKYGLSQKDLASTTAEVTTTEVSLNLDTGRETPISISGGPAPESRSKPFYQGSYNGTDYWLAYGTAKFGEPANTKGYIFASKDGGATLTLDRTYDLGAAESGSGRSEELRIGPDGSIYVLNQGKGSVWILEGANATPRLLGNTIPANYGGVFGGNNSGYLSADFDSGGNLQAAYRIGNTPTDNSKIRVYYQYFPKAAVKVTSVALMTQSSCPACDSLRTFLKDAGVQFQENPSDLSSSVAASVAAAIGSGGYPVLVRTGDDTVVKGGADAVSASRLLGLSKPALVTTYQPRVSNTGNPSGITGSLTLMPQWVLMIVENDQPKVVLDLREGVSAFSMAGGQWTSTVVLSTPPSVQDEQRITYSKRYPRFPGGAGGLATSTQHDVPFNKITKLSDLVYLYNSEQASVPDGFGNTVTQMGYTLWSTKAAGEASTAYRAIAKVSQLIPAGEFSIGLGPKGVPGTVKGELAAYVTAQGQVTDGADRFYKVTVDLRKQNEVAVDGNIAGRAIGGSIEIQTKTADGTSETREIAMVLLVDNTRLRVAQPGPGGNALDISSEAVHFTGANERWVVTNNLGLPNTIPCGSAKALTVPAHGTATFKLSDVAAEGVGTCLSGLEVAPTQLLGCETWDDAKLVLSAQAIDALAQSLDLERTEGGTNWELSFGSRAATVQRIISIDHLAGTAPHCASELEGATSAVVSVAGTILGDQEEYKPTLTVLDAGRDATTTAPLAKPGTLAWERDWLEFEANYLELTLKTSVADQALSKVMFLTTAGKKLGYQRQLLAVRALLHCNYEGTALPGVLTLVARGALDPDALKAPAVCLQDFVLNPMKHWPTYDRQLWSGTFETSAVGNLINVALAANPTVGFLAAAATGSPVSYGEFVLPHAADLEKKAASDPIYKDQATDFALDHYGRLMTAAARELTGTRGAITRAIFVSGPVERQAVLAVLDCAKSFGTDNPFGKLASLTTSRSYTAGIPCVDKAASGQPRIDAYRLVAAGMHSGLFSALLEVAGRDLDLLYASLELTKQVIAEVEGLEAKYPSGTTVAAWKADLPALDRLMIVRRHAEGIIAAQGHRLTVREAASIVAGLTECGAGLVKAIFSGEGVLLLGLGVGAAIAGPTAAAVGGLAFLLSGVAFTGLAATSLAQTWDGLDLAGKTAGICGVAISAMMTAVGVAGLRSAARGWTPAELKYAPPKVISIKALLSRGKGQAMPVEEQGAALSRRSGSVADVAAEAVKPPEQALQALLNNVPQARQAIVRTLAEKLGYGTLEAADRAAFDAMARAYGEQGGVTALAALRRAKLEPLLGNPYEATTAAAWYKVGAAMLAELLPGLPKSLRVRVASAGLEGADAELVNAALGDGQFLALEGSSRRGVTAADLQATTSLTQAFLRSDRALKAVQGPAGGSALTAEETSFLGGLQRSSQPGSSVSWLSSLARPAIVDALREGVLAARDFVGIPPGARLTGLTGDYITAGVFKSTYRLRATFEGVAKPVEIAFKKGIITPEEFALLQELAAKGLTQKPFLKAALHDIDGVEAVNIEEWVPGDTLIGSFTQKGVSAAVGEFDALLYLRTLKGTGTGARAYYNADLHWANMKAYVEGVVMKAKAIDFDPQFTKQATPEQYWASSLVRRKSAIGFGLPSFPEYLQGVVDAFAREPGSSAEAGLATIRKARATLADPVAQADGLSLQSMPGVTDLPAAVKGTIAEIDAFLATH